MRKNPWNGAWILVMLLLALALPRTAPGQPANPPANPPEHAGPPQDVVDRLLERGFEQVEPFVFQRPNADGSFETIAFDADGHEFLLRQLEAKLQVLQALEEESPLAERFDAILALEDLITRTEEVIRQAQQGAQETTATAVRLRGGVGDLAGAVAAAAVACDTSVHRLVDTTPTPTGPRSQGDANFSDSCGDFGEVTVNTYAEGTDNGNHTGMFDDCYNPGTGGATCAATSTVTATSNCFSDAYAEVRINVGGGLPVTWSLSDSGFVCRSLSATLTGPTSIYVPGYTTVGAVWAVSASGGTGSYTYEWRYNGVVVGSGTSYTRSYSNPTCSGGGWTDTVSVKVTDSSGASVTRSQSVTVTRQYCGGGGCLVVSSATTGGTSGIVPDPICP